MSIEDLTTTAMLAFFVFLVLRGALRGVGLAAPLSQVARVVWYFCTLTRDEIAALNGQAPTPEPEPEPVVSGVASVDYAAMRTAQAPAGPDWLRHINDMPDVNPHLAVCGPTGSGKSTLVLAALRQRPGQFVIATPKNAVDDPWGGFPAARLAFSREGVDWSNIGAAIELVYDEWLRRNIDGDAPRTPLTLVIDEYVTIIDKLPALKSKVIDLWAMGRSVGIRLIVLGTEVNVKAWGIEGRGDVRGNLLFIETRPDKSAAMYRWGSERETIDTSAVPKLAAGPIHRDRVWVPDVSGDAIDAAMIAQYSATIAGIAEPRKHSMSPDEWAQQVREMAENGMSTRNIRKALGGDYNEIVRLAREARGTEG